MTWQSLVQHSNIPLYKQVFLTHPVRCVSQNCIYFGVNNQFFKQFLIFKHLKQQFKSFLLENVRITSNFLLDWLPFRPVDWSTLEIWFVISHSGCFLIPKLSHIFRIVRALAIIQVCPLCTNARCKDITSGRKLLFYRKQRSEGIFKS